MRNQVVCAIALALLVVRGSSAQVTVPGKCTTSTPFAFTQGARWSGWSPDITNTRFQPAAQAGLSAADVPKLVLRWAFGFPSTTMAFAPPTVAGGRVFVGSQEGTVYSLDARTGCIIW